MNEFKFKNIINRKSSVIAENLRDEIMDALKQESAYALAIEKLSVSMAREKARAWTIIYNNYPEAAMLDLRTDLNIKTWELTYEAEEYTREGENVIEEIDPELYEVHTPPPIGIGEGN